MLKLKFLLVSIFAITSLLSPYGFANGLDDLKAALKALDGNEPIIAYYETRFLEVSDEDDDDDRKEKHGMVRVHLSDSELGLQVTYSQDVMNKIEAESIEKLVNEEADTPTLNAVAGINANRMRNLLSVSSSMNRMVAKAEFISEKAQVFEGQPVRLLTFDLPLDAIIDDKRTREYVSKFEGKYTILIDINGVPLESETHFKGKGSAFLILSINANSTDYNRYQVINNRLVKILNEYEQKYTSTFGNNVQTGRSLLIFDRHENNLELASSR